MQFHITDSAGAEYWTSSQAAMFLGIKVDTFKGYVSRDLAPSHAGHLDARTPLWRVDEITTWNAQRRGQGWRADS